MKYKAEICISALLCYFFIPLLVHRYFVVDDNASYNLGWAATVCFLMTFLFMTRKYFGILPGSTKVWYYIHIASALLGPGLVFTHSHFHIHSVNAGAAFIAMLLVIGSGFYGLFRGAKEQHWRYIHEPLLTLFAFCTIVHVIAVHAY